MGILKKDGRARYIILAAAAMLLLSIPYCPVWAEDAGPAKLYKQKIEAGLVYNFLKYTTWPDPHLTAGKGRLRVCLLGGDPFEGYLNPLQGRTAQQHVIEIAEIDGVSALAGCHLVYIARNQKAMIPEIIEQAQQRNFLTVSDIDEFTALGGMVEFSMEDDQRIHLLINRKSIDAAGLRVEDRLLRLAERSAGQ